MTKKETPDFPPFDSKTAENVKERLNQKMASYSVYGFNLHESSCLNIFFDLAQEFTDLESLRILPLLLLEMYFSMRAEIYEHMGDLAFKRLPWVVSSDDWRVPVERLGSGLFIDGGRVCIPILGRYAVDAGGEQTNRDLLGLMVLFPGRALDAHEKLFYEKLANRIGFALHNRTMAEKDQKHLSFVRNLVQDIGHNVLGPNMYFKLLLNQTEQLVAELGRASQELSGCTEDTRDTIKTIHLDLMEHMHEVQQHFGHSSLFLESLLRESHFIHGRYVLRPLRINFMERVLRPQFERYQPMFEAKGIEARLVNELPRDSAVMADVGLISQVITNMFSNVLKYAAATGDDGKAFTRCVLRKCNNGGVDYARVDVVSSGPHVLADEAAHLFEKYFRASGSRHIAGSGKGLFFVREIVKQHNGLYGYEAVEDGNLFYISLPLE